MNDMGLWWKSSTIIKLLGFNPDDVLLELVYSLRESFQAPPSSFTTGGPGLPARLPQHKVPLPEVVVELWLCAPPAAAKAGPRLMARRCEGTATELFRPNS